MSARTNNTDFFKHYWSELFKTTNKYCTITKIAKGAGIVYGSLIIPYNDKGIHKWVLKISPQINACTVGISEPAHVFSGKGYVHYGYCSNGTRRGPNGIQENYSHPYKGGIISIVLDLSQRKKQLGFKKNNNAMKTAFDIAKTAVGYSLAVYIGNNHSVGSTIHLLSYTCDKPTKYKSISKGKYKQVNVKSNDMWQPCDNGIYQSSTDHVTDDLWLENDQLKQQIDDLLFENDELSQNMEVCQMQLDNLLFEKSKLQQLVDEKNYELADKFNREKSIIQTMRRQITDLTVENNGLKAVNCKLMEEQKEYELKIFELKQMNKENVINYKQWNSNKILLWILSLDSGRYSKYEKMLCKSLAEEGICGDDLDNVDGADIKGWGIVNFKDKKYLQQKIKDLIKDDEGCLQEPTQQI